MKPKLKLNALDRAIGFFNPRAALQRGAARALLAAGGGYNGARRDKAALQEWSALGGTSADFDTLPDLSELRARSRDLVRNDPVAQSAVATKVVNVVGPGHVVRPEIDRKRLGLTAEQAEAWEEQALDIFTDWAWSTDCDITRTQTFAELEDLVYRSRLLSGDVFVVRRFKKRKGRMLATAVQVIEADLLSNPHWAMDTAQMAGGIEKDADGAPVAYHFADRYLLDRNLGGAVTWTRVPAYDGNGRKLVLHVHGAKWRPDMTRYAPMLSPVIEALKQRSRYSEAELMAAVVSACFAIGMKSPDGGLTDGVLELFRGKDDGGAAPASKAITITEPGKIIDLLPDEEIQSFAPGRPNPQFSPFITAIAQEIGAGTDLPHEILMKQFQASYSASKAALEIAWQFFRAERELHIAQFCAPVYDEVISEAVARGILKAPGFFSDPLTRQAWLGQVWMGPSRPTIDQTKDAAADEKYLEMGVTSLTRIAAERFGVDYRTVKARRALDGSDERQKTAGGTQAPGSAAPAEDEDTTDTDKETN
ncbi:phage portal protein [Cereibacter sp. SYSU M97828]|nr:phage portal protein [Cereibacter flavus]